MGRAYTPPLGGVVRCFVIFIQQWWYPSPFDGAMFNILNDLTGAPAQPFVASWAVVSFDKGVLHAHLDLSALRAMVFPCHVLHLRHRRRVYPARPRTTREETCAHLLSHLAENRRFVNTIRFRGIAV